MKDRGELLNDYLFGDLSDAERIELERQIAADPQLAAEVAELRPVVSQLEALPDEAWEAPAPPPLRLDREPARPEAQVAEESSGRKSMFGRLFGGSFAMRPAFAIASALLLFAGGLSIGLLSGGGSRTDPLGPSVQQASLSPVGSVDPLANGRADIKHHGNEIRLRLTGLAASGDHDFYEAWLMDPKNGFISLGTFRVGSDGAATLDLPVPVRTERFPIVDISLQPANGSPTHSGVSVLRGTLKS